MENIKSSTEYFVSAEDVQSPKYNITVLDRPLVRSLQIKIHSPAYTRIPPNIPEENIGDLDRCIRDQPFPLKLFRVNLFLRQC